MGFFSQDCHGCGHPLLSMYVTNSVNAWMNEVVVIRADGMLFTGFYDGYGRIPNSEEEEWSDEPGPVGVGYDDAGNTTGRGATVWHAACWRVAGAPIDWRGESSSSNDQGYFYNDPDHNMREPKKKSDLKAGRKLAEAVAERNRREEAKWAAE